jgi:hypothetical protein
MKSVQRGWSVNRDGIDRSCPRGTAVDSVQWTPVSEFATRKVDGRTNAVQEIIHQCRLSEDAHGSVGLLLLRRLLKDQSEVLPTEMALRREWTFCVGRRITSRRARSAIQTRSRARGNYATDRGTMNGPRRACSTPLELAELVHVRVGDAVLCHFGWQNLRLKKKKGQGFCCFQQDHENLSNRIAMTCIHRGFNITCYEVILC